MESIKTACICIVISIASIWICEILESKFIQNYLEEEILTIIITLLAINTATLGLIASKLQEVVIKYPDFETKNLFDEMKVSIYEQIGALVFAILVLVFESSELISWSQKYFIKDVCLFATFLFVLNVVKDIGLSVFDLLDGITKLK